VFADITGSSAFSAQGSVGNVNWGDLTGAVAIAIP
jgi:hypothetical protein